MSYRVIISKGTGTLKGFLKIQFSTRRFLNQDFIGFMKYKCIAIKHGGKHWVDNVSVSGVRTLYYIF